MLRVRYRFEKKWKTAFEKVHAFVHDHVKRALEETAQKTGSIVTVPSDVHTSSHRYALLHETVKEIRDPIEQVDSRY